MNTISKLLIFLFFVGGLYRVSFGQDSLVLDLPFTGNAADQSSYGNDGTVYGATLTSDRFGNPASAYLFDGIDDYIEVQDAPSLNPDNITLAAWVKAEEVVSATPDIIRKSTYADASDEQYYLRLAYDNYPQTAIKANTSCAYAPSGWTTNTSPVSVGLGEWHFLTATFDSLSLKLYIDGEYIQEVTLTSPAPLVECGSNLRIGRAWSTYPNPFKGVIDDIRIYNRPLKSCEIAGLFQEEKEPDVVTGVVESAKKVNLILFPNPVREQFVEIDGNISVNGKYEISSLAGIKIQSGPSKEKIDVSSLPPGTYILSVFSEDSVLIATERLVKM